MITVYLSALPDKEIIDIASALGVSVNELYKKEDDLETSKEQGEKIVMQQKTVSVSSPTVFA